MFDRRRGPAAPNQEDLTRAGPASEAANRGPGEGTPARGRRLQLIIGALAVVILGAAGSASAAVLIGSRQIKDGSLTGRDLKRDTVVGSDVRDHSLEKRDFAVVPRGTTGEPGFTGDRGTTGDVGQTDAVLAPVVPAFSTLLYAVPCPLGQKAVFGASSLPVIGMYAVQSAPAIDGSSWDFVISNNTDTGRQVSLNAICVTDG